MSLKENIKISPSVINHEEVSLACIRYYVKNGAMDKEKCLKILEDAFENNSPNIYLKDKKGIENSWTPLMMCCFSEFYEGVKYLLSKGANPNMPGKDGKTCLSICSIKDKVTITQLLYKKGAEINMKDKQGKTALMNACEKGNFDQVQFLLANKADIKIKNNENKDSIDIGREYKRYNIVSYLEHFYLNLTLDKKENSGKVRKI